MKHLLTNFIATDVEQPIKQGSLDHLQQAHQETVAALARQIIGDVYDATKVYILYGCRNSTVAPIYTVTAGAVFYNGEVYLVPAFSFTAGTVAIGTITENFVPAVNADPVEFTDGNTHNVHQILTMEVTDAASVGDLDFDSWIRAGVEDQIQVGAAGAPAFQNSWTGTIIGLYFRRDNVAKTVTVHGFAQRTPIPVLPAAGSIIFTLPVGYRPSAIKNTGLEITYDTANHEICSVVVNFNGEVYCAKYVSGVGSVVGAAGFSVTFYID